MISKLFFLHGDADIIISKQKQTKQTNKHQNTAFHIFLLHFDPKIFMGRNFQVTFLLNKFILLILNPFYCTFLFPTS